MMSILPSDITAACAAAEEKYNQTRTALQETQQELKAVNEQIHHLGTYLATKKIYSEFLNAPDEAAFHSTHAEEIGRYERARAYLQDAYPDEAFPTMKSLKTKKDRLQQMQTRHRSELKPVSNQRKTLQIVQKNIESIFGDANRLPKRKHELQQ